VVSVIDRAELVQIQKVGQLACIHAIILVAVLQQSVPSWIADHQLRDMRLQQVVQPGGPGSF
jgi:hypothetical protein